MRVGQGSSLSPLLFVIIIVPLSLTLRDPRAGYQLKKINHLLFVFGIDKCSVLELERGRLVRSEGIELPYKERTKEVEQEGYQYLVVLQLYKTMNKEMKESIGNEHFRRVKLICKSNLNAGKFFSGLNAWALGVMRYSKGRKFRGY